MYKILLIEDEDFIREVYKEELESSGFLVDDFEKGYDVFCKNAYDIVVLDIVLPDINGLHVLKNIKKNNGKKHIPVLLLSNLDQDIIVRQGLQFGAEEYLEKVDNTPNMIVEKIRSILNKEKSREKSGS